MTTPGPTTTPPHSPKKEKKSKPEFKLSVHLSPLSHKVATRLPRPTAINDLWDLDINNLGTEITMCLSMLFSHVVERGEPRENIRTFHHSGAATALQEAHDGKKIKGKDHALKAGGLFNKVKNLLSSIKNTLKHVELDEDKTEILLNFQAILIAHHNNLVVALQAQPQSKKDHLERNANIKVDELAKIDLTQDQNERIKETLPPSPVKGLQQSTPKKLSPSDRSSIYALQSDRPLSSEDFEYFAASLETVTPVTTTPSVEETPSYLLFKPRQVITKGKHALARPDVKTPKKQLFTEEDDTADSPLDLTKEPKDSLAKLLQANSDANAEKSAKRKKLPNESSESDSQSDELELLESVQPAILTSYKKQKVERKLSPSSEQTALEGFENTKNMEKKEKSCGKQPRKTYK